MKTAVTVCLVSQARNGPFVFHDGLADACSRAAHVGFDAVEIFPRSADAIDCAELAELLAANHLAVAAIGTGAGWLVDRMSLTSPDEDMRLAARHFIASSIRLGGRFGAPAIIGSMQGRLAGIDDRELAYDWLGEALDELGELAGSVGVPLLFEPLNRYETDLFNRLEAASDFVNSLKTKNVRLLADLFHMNIEEPDLGWGRTIGRQVDRSCSFCRLESAGGGIWTSRRRARDFSAPGNRLYRILVGRNLPTSHGRQSGRADDGRHSAVC